jgi:hypothetical protein
MKLIINSFDESSNRLPMSRILLDFPSLEAPCSFTPRTPKTGLIFIVNSFPPLHLKSDIIREELKLNFLL